MIRRPPRSTRTDTLFPYPTLFRSRRQILGRVARRLPTLHRDLCERRQAEAGERRACQIAQLLAVIVQHRLTVFIAPRLALGHVVHVVGLRAKPPVRGEVIARQKHTLRSRSEERRVGKECVSTCRSRWWPYH